MKVRSGGSTDSAFTTSSVSTAKLPDRMVVGNTCRYTAPLPAIVQFAELSTSEVVDRVRKAVEVVDTVTVAGSASAMSIRSDVAVADPATLSVEVTGKTRVAIGTTTAEKGAVMPVATVVRVVIVFVTSRVTAKVDTPT